MKAIMYHYVREYSSNHPNFRFLDIKNFLKQLDFFEEKFGFVSREDWALAIKNRSLGNAKGKVLLTFDDAMSCHYEYVFPELKKRNLWGIFYVSTQPYTSARMLDVHRIHLLCGALEGNKLLETLFNYLKEEMIPDQKIKEFREKPYSSQKNYEGVSEFKRILNYFVSYDYRESLISKVATQLGDKFDVHDFYVPAAKLKEMCMYGNIIGSHTVTHPVMSKLNCADQSTEITESFAFLEELGCQDSKTYCHPYGGFHSFNDITVETLFSQQVEYSFNVESRDIEDSDFISSIQCLPRFDCNEFPYGKTS